MNFHHDDFYDTDEVLDDDMSKQLIFPYSKFEPEVAEDELRRLDAIADSVEIKRLTGMQVLTNAADMPNDAKVLPTRFVRTWREKLDKDGQQIWLRRSRFVAREFAWMESERDCLFSPASSSIVARLLPVMFLEMQQHCDAVMLSCLE